MTAATPCEHCGTTEGEIASPTASGVMLCADCVGAESHPPNIVSLQEFAEVDEPGAEPLLGEPGEVVISEGGDVMIYGDGGASKTTLSIDLAFHLAAGQDWLGIHVQRKARVLLIEAEGPRPLFRKKLWRKRNSWTGGDVDGHLYVLENPWGDFRFPGGGEIARLLGEQEIDVLIVGPLTKVGMEELGTLQQVRDFVKEIEKFRAGSGRRLAIVLIHHENKGGTVSGAWEGAGDTLLHATVRGRGKTTLFFQKARWAPRWHRETLELEWAEGEAFEPIQPAERDLLAEIQSWLLEHPHSTVKEIAGGVKASEPTTKTVLEERQDIFRLRTGQAAQEIGRASTANAWEVRVEDARNCAEPPAQSSAHALLEGEEERSARLRSPVRSADATSALTLGGQNGARPPAQFELPPSRSDVPPDGELP